MLEIRIDAPLDLRGTLAPLVAGPGDPTHRVTGRDVLRASRTPEGPATVHVVRAEENLLRAQAWGDGAHWLLERLPDLLGLYEEPVQIPDAAPEVRALERRARGVRLPRTRRVVEMLILIVLQQLVSGKEAARAFRNVVRTFSEPAPGPFRDLWLPLDVTCLRTLPPAALPSLGVLPRQGRTLRELGWRAARIEEADRMEHHEAEARLRALDGIGVWSARSALLRGMGHPDAVPLGDYNLPNSVAFNLAGEERADDARMLELLEPYRGQRGRVLRWIHVAGRRPPRRGPRSPLRPLPLWPGGSFGR